MPIASGVRLPRARLWLLTAAGLAISSVAGVLAGTSAVDWINPVYRGGLKAERPARSAEMPDDQTAALDPVIAYGGAPAYASSVDPAFDAPSSDPSFEIEQLERDADADYRRWQAQLDAEAREDGRRIEEPPYAADRQAFDKRRSLSQLAAADKVVVEDDAEGEPTTQITSPLNEDVRNPPTNVDSIVPHGLSRPAARSASSITRPGL